MDFAKMNQEKHAVPTTFRGLRILLLDSDTASLLDLAAQLENCSYRVTTTELPTIALSILQERADRFDLIMAEIDMPEMDCFKFIKSVQLIKDLPIILISAESNKNVVVEAMIKGACFFLKKPISSKNLKNVWQHVYRKTNCKNVRKIEIKSGDIDQEAKVEEKEKVVEIVNGRITSNEPENEQVGDSDQAKDDRGGLVDGTKLTKSTQVGRKRPLSPENDEPREIKRKRSDGEGSKLSQNSHRQRKFPTTKVEVKKKPGLATEFASSSYSTNHEQLQARVETDEVNEVNIQK